MVELGEFHGNRFDGAFPEALAAVTSLAQLTLSQVGLRGALPAELLCRMTSLESLKVFMNLLSGTLPDLRCLSHLESFDGSLNRFTGVLVGRWPDSLKEWVVAENRLAGSIPWVGHLTSIAFLGLWSNHFEGTLPWLPAMSGMEKYIADSNKLQGPILGGNFSSGL
eukprot:2855988-Amphidinium_carterae.1